MKGFFIPVEDKGMSNVEQGMSNEVRGTKDEGRSE